MSRLTEESVTNLISLWLDMSRPRNQHTVDPKSVKWNSSIGYNVVNENIEIIISDKLNITMQECKIMLYSGSDRCKREKIIHKKTKNGS